ncbi:MAG: sulfatase-like hydrolase/transferase [Acidobacteria bacterium]|jgi:arylsulfatase A-like enzyme/Tfp pilus assembly protein PilF|nr:sulfatase-like hydrolase/transferase [Acidobacteriota bacterium]
MKKKTALAILALLVLGGGLLLLLRRGRDAAPWNVLVITLDTTRADHLGAYGYAAARTPNLDRLAAAGVVFENASTSVPLTLPAHATLFTGRHPIATRVRNNGNYFLPESETTLAEVLSHRGYDTRAVVSAFVLLSKFGLNQGFSIYDDSLDTHEMIRNYRSEIPAAMVFEKFSAWLDGSAGRPFFYWLHFYDPHTPYRPPQEYAKLFPDNPMGKYDGEIAYTDAWVGRVIASLGERGLLERTLVIIAGDHGEAFGEHVEHGHGIFCYEETLHVPLIVHAPGRFKPRRVAARVGLVDVMPTVLEALGAAMPPAVQGASFLSELNGRSAKEERVAYFESLYGLEEMNWAPLTGLLHRGYKYVSLPDAELYDLATDRFEKQNLFLRKNILARDMDRRLAAFVAGHSQGGDARRALSAGDKEQLQALGYISTFSSQAATVLDPKKGVLIDARLKQISQMIGQKKTTEAEAALRGLLAENPGLKMPHVYNLQYKLHMSKREVGPALNSLRQGIADFPDVENFRQTLAVALFDLKMYDKAEERCREILDKNPRNTRTVILLGEIREKQGRPAEAAEQYARARDIEPQNVSLRIKYAELLISLKQYERAVAEYNQLMENEEASSQPDLLLKVALLNTRYGSMADAEQMLARAAAIQPAGKFFFNYALVLAKNGKLDLALANMETALERHGRELTPEQRQTAAKALAAWR